MQNRSEFWNENLHLEGIKNLIVSMVERKGEDLSFIDRIELDGLCYEIKLESKGKGRNLKVTCNDGRTLFINLELNDNKNSHVHSYEECLVQCKYTYKEKKEKKEQKLEFASNSMRILDTFGLSYINEVNLINTVRYDRYNEYNRLRTVDCLDNGVILYIVFTSECAFKYNYIITPDLIFANDGKNNFLVSNDFKLLKINEQDAVDYEQLKKFKPIDEIMKIKEIVKNNSSNLNPLTLKSLDTIMIDLKKQDEFVKMARIFYEGGGLTTLKEAVRDYNKMLEFASNHVFSEDELVQVCNLINIGLGKSGKQEFSNESDVKTFIKKIK